MISIIVPVFNTEKYLHRCIDSILSQDFTDFELLLINDGSKDSSGKICDEYAQKDSRVRVFHKENGGVASARNLGLANARGEWIGWVDSDDYIDVDMYKSLYKKAKSMNADIAYCNYKMDNYVSKMPLDSLPKGEFLKQYLFVPVNSLWMTLTKRDLYIKNGISFEEGHNFAEDLLITMKLFYFAEKLCCVKKGMYHYTINPDSLSQKGQDDYKWSMILRSYILLNAFFKDTPYYSSLVREFAHNILYAKRVILFRHKDITRWFNIEPWSHRYIFSNGYYGTKEKIIEWAIIKLYSLCLKLANVRII